MNITEKNAKFITLFIKNPNFYTISADLDLGGTKQ